MVNNNKNNNNKLLNTNGKGVKKNRNYVKYGQGIVYWVSVKYYNTIDETHHYK